MIISYKSHPNLTLGALLELEDRARLQEFIQKKDCLNLPPADASKGDTIFEYTVSEEGLWVHWDTLVTKYIYPEDSIPRSVFWFLRKSWGLCQYLS